MTAALTQQSWVRSQQRTNVLFLPGTGIRKDDGAEYLSLVSSGINPKFLCSAFDAKECVVLIDMLPVSKSVLVEKNAVLFFLGLKLQVLSGKMIMWDYFRFPSSSPCPLANWWFIRLQG